MVQSYTYYVYVVKCHDNYYYTGVTNDLDRRLDEHNKGFDKRCFTYKRRPVELMYVQIFNDIKQAIAWEKQLKGWGRKKKEALFKDDWKTIVELAKNSTVKSQTDNPSTGSG